MKKRLLSLLLVCIMVLGVLPAAALAEDQNLDQVPPTQVSTSANGVNLMKKVTGPVDGTYTLTMEAYVEGTVTQSTPDPLDIVLVLDVSGSMAEDISITTASVKKNVSQTQLSTYLDFKYGNGEYFYSEDGKTFYPIVNIERSGVVLTAQYTYTYQVSEDTTNSVTISIWDDSNYWNHIYYETTESITHSKLSELKSGVNALLNETKKLNDSITDTSKQHRVSVVKFASDDTKTEVGNDWYDPDAGTVWQGQVKYNYTQVVSKLTENMAATKTAVDALFAGGATAADKGLELAKSVFDDASASRKKVVIFFTDGEPTYGNSFSTTVANAAIGNAKTMKNAGVTVYSIGVVKGADPADTTNRNVNKFLNAVSSNYPDAESMSSLGTGSNAGYYKTASQSGQLATIFGSIISEIATPAVDETTVLTDTLSDYFVFPTGTTGTDVTVKVSTASGSGTRADWSELAAVEGVTATISGKTVSVSGFDYSANPVVQGADGSWSGQKLVISFPIQADMTEITETGYYPTNNTTTSKAGLGDTELEQSPEVPITVEVPEDPTYTLTYDLNGGTGGPAPNPVTGLTAQTYTLNTTAPTHAPAADGTPIVFIGWTAEADSKIYAKGDTAPTTITEVTIANDDVTVYAVWGYDTNENGTPDVLEEWITITYNANGGTWNAHVAGYEMNFGKTTASVEVAKVHRLSALIGTAPSRDGYDFTGWYWDEACENKVTIPKDAFIELAADTIFYAGWKQKEIEPELKSELTVTKTVDKRTAKVGDTLTYTVTVKNTGDVTLEKVSVSDELSNGTKLVLKDGNGNPVTVISVLRSGESVTLHATYKVKDSDAGKSLVNTAAAEVSSDLKDDGSSEATEIKKDDNTPAIIPVLNKKDHVAYIIGYEDLTVRPENNITRAEVATIFFRLMDDSSRSYFWSQKNDFSDVSRNDWFNNAVSTMANAGILSGYPDGSFKPNAPITRAEFSAIAARFSDVIYGGKSSFSDVDKSFWAYEEIALAEHLGWITGYPDGTFKPGKNITRAEAMTLINRVLERAVEQEHMLKDMVQWKDNSPSAWYYEAVQEATNSHTYTRLSKKVPNQSFNYEDWVKILENPDWAALEKTWSKN